MRSPLPVLPLGLALFAAAFHLVAQFAGWGWPALAAKPVPVLCLAWIAWRATGETAPGRRVWLVAGLMLSAVGDIVLALPGAVGADAAATLAGPSFMGGLGAFLLAHLCYVFWFLSLDRSRRLARLAAPAVYTIAFLVVLRPHLGALLLPVLAYALVITLMLWRALAAADGAGLGLLGRPAAWGAILFVLSDSLIALNRFVEPLPLAALRIMLTYWAGQCGIFLSHRRRS